jgi:ribonuclease HII
VAKLLANYSGLQPEAGVDEAGRGCLAGPVVAAAVVLPTGFECDELNDSKQLSAPQREKLNALIKAEALAWSVAMIDHIQIDKTNILKASIAAMHKAIAGLSFAPAFLVIDGNRFYPYPGIRHSCVVKGDGKIMSIAAASVLAKYARDTHMLELHDEFPVYGWHQNKGYPTKAHRKAILEHGPSPLHRMSFKLLAGDAGRQERLQL